MSNTIFISTETDTTGTVAGEALRFDKSGLAHWDWVIVFDTFRERKIDDGKWEMSFDVVSNEVEVGGTYDLDYYKTILQEWSAKPTTWANDARRSKSMYWYFYDDGVTAERAFMHSMEISQWSSRFFVDDTKNRMLATLKIVRGYYAKVASQEDSQVDVDGSTTVLQVPSMNDKNTRVNQFKLQRNFPGVTNIGTVWVGFKPYNVEDGEDDTNSEFQPYWSNQISSTVGSTKTVFSVLQNQPARTGGTVSTAGAVKHFYGDFMLLMRWRVSNTGWTGSVSPSFSQSSTKIIDFETIYINGTTHTDWTIAQIGVISIPSFSVRRDAVPTGLVTYDAESDMALQHSVLVEATKDSGGGDFFCEFITIPYTHFAYADNFDLLFPGVATPVIIFVPNEDGTGQYSYAWDISSPKVLSPIYGDNDFTRLPRQGGVITAIGMDTDGKHLNFTDNLFEIVIDRSEIRDGE